MGSPEYWAHVLWQRHNLRMEEFEAMEDETRYFYIASETYEQEHPHRLDTISVKKGGT